jgi:hypothetical protein
LLVFISCGTAIAGVIEQDAEDAYSCDLNLNSCSEAVDENWGTAYSVDISDGPLLHGVTEIYNIPTGVVSAKWTTKITKIQIGFVPNYTVVWCSNQQSSIPILNFSDISANGSNITIDIPSDCLNGDKLIIHTYIQDEADFNTRYYEGMVTWTIPTEGIPEYQSIVLPMAGILGIVLLLSRRRV